MPIVHPSAHTVDNTLTATEYVSAHSISANSVDFGSGTTIYLGSDVNLYDGGANLLKTDDDFSIYGDEKALLLTTSSYGEATIKITDRLYIDTPKAIRFRGEGGDTLEIGNDTNLYRSGANTLKTNDSFYAVGNISTDGNVDGVDLSGFKTAYDAHDHNAGDPTQISHDNLTNVSTEDHFIAGDNLSWDGTTLNASGNGGAGSLSDLTIDTHKDWQGYNITNIGTIEATSIDVSRLDAYYITSHMRGYPTETKDIGQSAYEFKNLYLNNTIFLGGYQIAKQTGYVEIVTELRTNDHMPRATNVYSLGWSSGIWDKLYINTINIGADVNLYRGASNQLKTNDAFYAVGNILTDGNIDGVDLSAFKTAYDSHDHSVADPTQVSHDNLTNVSKEDHFVAGDNLTWDNNTLDASGGGVTDHGSLSGLDDDDHSQYWKTNTGRSSHLVPASSNDYNLGSTSGEWENVYVGTGKIYFGTNQDTDIYKKGANNLATDDMFTVVRTLASHAAIELLLSGEGYARLYIEESGKHWWGDGSGGQDTNLYRSQADQLKTDDDFAVTAGKKIYTDFIQGISATNLTFMPNTSAYYVQIGYGGVPRGLHVYGTLDVHEELDMNSKKIVNIANLDTAINTTWTLAGLSGTQTKINISGRGTSYVVNSGDGHGDSIFYVVTDGSTIFTWAGNVADQCAVSFHNSLLVKTYSVSSINHPGGKGRGNYHSV